MVGTVAIRSVIRRHAHAVSAADPVVQGCCDDILDNPYGELPVDIISGK